MCRAYVTRYQIYLLCVIYKQFNFYQQEMGHDLYSCGYDSILVDHCEMITRNRLYLHTKIQFTDTRNR